MFDKNVNVGDINNSNIQNIGNTSNINLNEKFIIKIIISLLIVVTFVTLCFCGSIDLNTI